MHSQGFRTLVLGMFFAGLGGISGRAGASPSEDALSDPGALTPAIHATRLDYSAFEVPEAVTVITQEDIREAGYLKISEIFRSVPGFRIVNIGSESRVSYHGTTARQVRQCERPYCP
jgi:outer membrane receptor for ferrienterochelin and colicin